MRPRRTLADLLDHARAWISHTELVGRTALACVDGRTPRGVVGSPGGSMGELLAVLAAAEALHGAPLPAPFVAEAVRLTAAHLGLYHHSDEHALAPLRRQGLLPADLPDPEAWLRHPPAAVRADLRRALGEPETTGCGHVAAMLRPAPGAPLRPALVQSVLRTFFDLLWAGTPGLDFEVLTGPHQESSVVVVRSCGAARAWGRTPAITPRAEDSVFVLHIDAARWFRRQVAQLLLDNLAAYLPGIRLTGLLEASDRIAEAALETTLQRLAPELPVHELVPPCAHAAK